jgi:hypothetical protein
MIEVLAKIIQSSYSEKKPTANSMYTVNKIVIFIEIFF